MRLTAYLHIVPMMIMLMMMIMMTIDGILLFTPPIRLRSVCRVVFVPVFSIKHLCETLDCVEYGDMLQ